MDFANCTVLPFDYERDKPDESTAANVIRSIIAAKTGRSLSQITDREQLRYLLAYLSSREIGAKTVVVESEYIDRHFLEDYAEYYSRCFAERNRLCARLHFFSEEFSEKAFIDHLRSYSADFYDALKRGYLGFCVIRPMPETYLGRISAAPYPRLVDFSDRRGVLITKATRVNLFGNELVVDTIGLREQDRVLSVCATSAIWVLLSGYGDLSSAQMPSLSQITKVASEQESPNGRIFPSSGLTPTQIAYCLRRFGLEPLCSEVPQQNGLLVATLRRWCNAYLSAKIPVLIGGRVLKVKSSEGNEVVFDVGDHYVCALGYRKGEDAQQSPDANFIENSSTISKLFVHDDRYGQYLSIDLQTKDLTVEDGADDEEHVTAIPIRFGFRHETTNDENEEVADEYFVPTNVIVGTNHKIRVSYLEILNLLNAFAAILRRTLYDIQAIRAATADANREKFDVVIDAMERVLQGTWDVRLCSIKDYKESLVAVDTTDLEWYSSIGNNPEDLLTTNLPKNLWLCDVRDRHGSQLMELLFDTTEPMQGDVFLGYVARAFEFDAIWQELRNQVYSHTWDRHCEAIGDNVGQQVRSIQAHLFKRDILLDSLFGQTRFPRRNLKRGEFGESLEVTEQRALITIPPHQGAIWTSRLDDAVTYIWVIDDRGFLVVGVDRRVRSEDDPADYDFQGHPTLIGYQPARIGGELWYGLGRKTTESDKVRGWWINTASRAYSGHLYSAEHREIVLKNVIDNRFLGFEHVHDGHEVCLTTASRPN